MHQASYGWVTFNCHAWRGQIELLKPEKYPYDSMHGACMEMKVIFFWTRLQPKDCTVSTERFQISSKFKKNCSFTHLFLKKERKSHFWVRLKRPRG